MSRIVALRALSRRLHTEQARLEEEKTRLKPGIIFSGREH